MTSNDKFWDKYFRMYDVLNNVYPYQELLESVLSSMKLHPGKIVLDAGTGTGNLAVLIHNKGADVIGLDSSKAGLKRFSEKLPQGKVIIHNLIDKIPLNDSTVDYVCCVNTLFTIPPNRRRDVCREFNRVLKVGGKIILVNLTDKYRPIHVYLYHIKKEIIRTGLIVAILNIARLIWPTVVMFYYNYRMRRSLGISGEISFFKKNEQIELLKSAGFTELSETKSIFANQAIQNTAIKI